MLKCQDRESEGSEVAVKKRREGYTFLLRIMIEYLPLTVMKVTYMTGIK